MSMTCEVNIANYLSSLGFKPGREYVVEQSSQYQAYEVRLDSDRDCLMAGQNMSWSFYQLFVKFCGAVGTLVSDALANWSERELTQLGGNELKSFFLKHCCHDNPNLICREDGKQHLYLLNRITE